MEIRMPAWKMTEVTYFHWLRKAECVLVDTMALQLRERLERFCNLRRIKRKVDTCTESGCFPSHACRLHTGMQWLFQQWSDVDWSLEVMLQRGHLIEGGSKRPSSTFAPIYCNSTIYGEEVIIAIRI